MAPCMGMLLVLLCEESAKNQLPVAGGGERHRVGAVAAGDGVLVVSIQRGCEDGWLMEVGLGLCSGKLKSH